MSEHPDPEGEMLSQTIAQLDTIAAARGDVASVEYDGTLHRYAYHCAGLASAAPLEALELADRVYEKRGDELWLVKDRYGVWPRLIEDYFAEMMKSQSAGLEPRVVAMAREIDTVGEVVHGLESVAHLLSVVLESSDANRKGLTVRLAIDQANIARAWLLLKPRTRDERRYVKRALIQAKDAYEKLRPQKNG